MPLTIDYYKNCLLQNFLDDLNLNINSFYKLSQEIVYIIYCLLYFCIIKTNKLSPVNNSWRSCTAARTYSTSGVAGRAPTANWPGHRSR